MNVLDVKLKIYLNLLVLVGFTISSCSKQKQKISRVDQKLLDSLKEKSSAKNENCEKKLFYRDLDHDGYGDSNNKILTCKPPSGYVEKKGDCDDNDIRVHPAQRNFFSTPRKNGSFDFDCDGKESKRLIVRAYCKEKLNGKGCIFTSGWDISSNQKIPSCGQPAAWAWNECRNELLDPEKPKNDVDNSKTINTTDNNNLTKDKQEQAKPTRTLPYEVAKQKTIYRCWTGHLKWKKRQLCR